MTITEFYMTRNDGTNLYRTIDAKIDENGMPLRDEHG